MSYTKHTWTDGELVTATKMNNIENGIEEASSGGGVLMVNGTWNDNVCTLDKTWQEICDGGFCVVKFVDNFSNGKGYGPIVDVVQGHNVYYVDVIYYGDTLIVIRFSTSSASDYPSSTEE